MKKWIGVCLFLLFFLKGSGQVVTQTYIDPCDLKTYVVTIPITNNSGVTVIIRGKSKVFTYAQFTSGEVDQWIKSIFAAPCPSSLVVQQTVTAAVSQAASSAASSAASAAASSAASSGASGAASSSASSAASSSASSSSSSQSSSSSGESSSSGGGSGSSEEGGGSESSSESKSDEKKEEKKNDKKEEKKKSVATNPMLVASDLTTAQGPDLKYSAIVSFGVSKSSMAGNESWGATALIWSTLKQFALSGGYTKMDFNKGQLNAIHSYSVTGAYLEGNYMSLVGYTYIKPHPKFGTYGYNLGAITLLLKDTKIINSKTGETKEIFNTSFSTSVVTFWTKPYVVDKKITLSPQVFLMNSPISWNSKTGETTVSRQFGFLVGSSFDYKISKRFGFSFNYKLSGSTQKGAPLLNNFLIGSRVIL
jgi:hypothetical protein